MNTAGVSAIRGIADFIKAGLESKLAYGLSHLSIHFACDNLFAPGVPAGSKSPPKQEEKVMFNTYA
jgi:hypothetical protein